MPDREKVIRELETLGAWHTHHYAPFHDEAAETIHDAISLLREQEPVKPNPTGIEPHYNCGKCRLPIQQGYPFCPWCGSKVKWDD